MYHRNSHYAYFTVIVLCLFLLACNNSEHNSTTKEKQIVTNPNDMDEVTTDNIEAALSFAVANAGKVDDTIKLQMVKAVEAFYKSSKYKPVWSKKEKWEPLADTLFSFIKNAELQGLFPKEYHDKNLQSLKHTLDTDSLKRMDAVLWTKADLMLTDGFMYAIYHLKHGRLQPDSLSLNKDSVLAENFFAATLKTVLEKKEFTSTLNTLQPKHKGYWDLKNGIKRFLDSMDRRTYTYVTYPYKKGDVKDSTFFIKNLQKRLAESNCIDFVNKMPDSSQLSNAVKKYQKNKGLKTDGKVSTALIKTLNISDAERFKRIAITLDKYKQMPEKMPEKYIWVNLPGYYLQVWDKDTLALESKVICGKPETRTPLLTSKITDMVTYPTWTVPTSIIVKQYLPKLKNNPNYLSRLGLRLVNGKGQTISGSDVNWAKYSKGIPYRIMQGSGDNNALGVFKFNFNNPYSVYLHDTNQRYLFKNSSRALSHGCVRVQEWEKLAFYIARNDSMNTKPTDTLKYNTDSIKNWIAQKENHRLDVKHQIPLYIRYLSCEGKDGKIKFYDDMYGEDKLLREKYFGNK
ncbi:MAG: L,D-transpeptidase family protein [Chitinophagaceae bacterium]|nr:L,D-transpeptidase family protein [Chitinophagaceae bacterium]